MILLACAECLPVVQSADTLGSEESDGDSEPSSVESADEWSDAEDDGSGYERYTDTLDADGDHVGGDGVRHVARWGGLGGDHADPGVERRQSLPTRVYKSRQ